MPPAPPSYSLPVAQFVDECNLHAKAGDGGAGSVAFRREAHVADHNVASLLSFKDHPFRRGGDGTHGMGKGRHGKAGEDTVALVPEGTVVRDRDGTVLADLEHAGDRNMAAEWTELSYLQKQSSGAGSVGSGSGEAGAAGGTRASSRPAGGRPPSPSRARRGRSAGCDSS